MGAGLGKLAMAVNGFRGWIKLAAGGGEELANNIKIAAEAADLGYVLNTRIWVAAAHGDLNNIVSQSWCSDSKVVGQIIFLEDMAKGLDPWVEKKLCTVGPITTGGIGVLEAT